MKSAKYPFWTLTSMVVLCASLSMPALAQKSFLEGKDADVNFESVDASGCVFEYECNRDALSRLRQRLEEYHPVPSSAAFQFVAHTASTNLPISRARRRAPQRCLRAM